MNWYPYPERRQSGVQWLQEIPDHWMVRNPKTLFSRHREPAHEDDRQLTASQQDGVVYQDEFMESRGTRVVQVIEGQAGLKHVSAGDFVISLRSFQGGIEWSAVAGKISPAYTVLTPGPEVAERFFVHLLKSDGFIQELRSTSNQLRDGQSLGLEHFAQVAVPLPPRQEQISIADFLDRETAKIDALIAKQEQLIATLREDRTATITHAVTKGLDRNVEMKYSGAEWLGDVPQHWNVRQLKWGCPVKRGASPRPIDDPKYFDDEGHWAWVRIADVSASPSGHLYETTQRLSELGSSLSVKLKPGSLFVSIAGTVGKPCINHIPACIHDGFVYFPDLDMDADYLFRIFEAGECYRGLGKLGTQLNLNTDTIGSILMPFPPRPEQREIVDFLAVRCEKIDTLIAKVADMIRKLQECRAALITDAVTGKIDVRGVE